MPELTKSPRLRDFQKYVSELEIERGFSDESAKDKCLLLGEEIGELFKAIRKADGIAVDPASRVGDIRGELADILIYLCSIANRFEINMESAFLEKEVINKQRTWIKS